MALACKSSSLSLCPFSFLSTQSVHCFKLRLHLSKASESTSLVLRTLASSPFNAAAKAMCNSPMSHFDLKESNFLGQGSLNSLGEHSFSRSFSLSFFISTLLPRFRKPCNVRCVSFTSNVLHRSQGESHSLGYHDETESIQSDNDRIISNLGVSNEFDANNIFSLSSDDAAPDQAEIDSNLIGNEVFKGNDNFNNDCNGSSPHIPVLLQEVVQSFNGCYLRNFIDCTVGAGGHSVALILNHPEIVNFVAMDVDPVAHAESALKISSALDSVKSFPNFESESESSEAGYAKLRISKPDIEPPVKFYPLMENFENLADVLARVNMRPGQVNGILLDIGVSSMQIDVAERGFSFMKDGKLDMRMNPKLCLTAEEIINEWSESELGNILRDYGEERRWRFLAQKIVRERARGRISTTQDLTRIIGGSKGKRHGIHPATRTFQALRIAVNNELQVLEKLIPAAINALAPRGRLAIITFHSLEDRIVKKMFQKYEKIERLNLSADSYIDPVDKVAAAAAAADDDDSGVKDQKEFGFNKYRNNQDKKHTTLGFVENDDDGSVRTGFERDVDAGFRFNVDYDVKEKKKEWKKKKYGMMHKGIIKILTKKPIVASDDEINVNPRSRSAKLRVVEKM